MSTDAPTLVALIRHGQTPYNTDGRYQGSSDIELNDRGREQALEAASYLTSEFPDVTWDVVRTSPMLRAKETGEVIAKELGIEKVLTLPSLVERDWASAEGNTIDDMYATYDFLQGLSEDEAREQFPGVEPKDLVTARGRFALQSIAERHPGQNVVVTAHGTILRLLLADVLGSEFPNFPNAGVAVCRVNCNNMKLHVTEVARSFDVDEV